MKHIKHLFLLLIICGLLDALPSSLAAFQFNPAIQPFVPFKQGSAPRYPAPEFTLDEVNGDRVSLSAHRGSVVVLMFWTTW